MVINNAPVYKTAAQRKPTRTLHFPPFPYTMRAQVRMAFRQVTLALVMSFRLGRCAVRFYEARTAFAGIVSGCRVLSSEVCAYCTHDMALRDLLLGHVVALPIAVKNWLRELRGDPNEYKGALSDAQTADLLQAHNPPLVLLHRLRLLATEVVNTRGGNESREVCHPLPLSCSLASSDAIA